ncbi:MAG TPA: hypothetical protein VG406_12890 [Isosphaeraceae bacterium]|jgi:hypothetical protein|nr:hypothetical protein [Isosphaeraceae bacterium]
MIPELPERVTVPLEAAAVPIDPRRPGRIGCRRCGRALELNQPDPDDPDRWLGTCPACGCWQVVEILDGERMALVVVLPVVDLVREAIRAAGARPDRPD